jgi:hypothetical protein
MSYGMVEWRGSEDVASIVLNAAEAQRPSLALARSPMLRFVSIKPLLFASGVKLSPHVGPHHLRDLQLLCRVLYGVNIRTGCTVLSGGGEGDVPEREWSPPAHSSH